MIQHIQITSETNNFEDYDLVCFCFEYTKKDIKEDLKNHGYSTILEKIKIEKNNKGCSCEVKNPKGK